MSIWILRVAGKISTCKIKWNGNLLRWYKGVLRHKKKSACYGHFSFDQNIVEMPRRILNISNKISFQNELISALNDWFWLLLHECFFVVRCFVIWHHIFLYHFSFVYYFKTKTQRFVYSSEMDVISSHNVLCFRRCLIQFFSFSHSFWHLNW